MSKRLNEEIASLEAEWAYMDKRCKRLEEERGFAPVREVIKRRAIKRALRMLTLFDRSTNTYMRVLAGVGHNFFYIEYRQTEY